MFAAGEVARLAVRGLRGEPRRAAGTGDFVIESGLTDVAERRIRYRGLEAAGEAIFAVARGGLDRARHGGVRPLRPRTAYTGPGPAAPAVPGPRPAPQPPVTARE